MDVHNIEIWLSKLDRLSESDEHLIEWGCLFDTYNDFPAFVYLGYIVFLEQTDNGWIFYVWRPSHNNDCDLINTPFPDVESAMQKSQAYIQQCLVNLSIHPLLNEWRDKLKITEQERVNLLDSCS